MNSCRSCGRPGNAGGRFSWCQECVEQAREDHHCPDCASVVDVVVIEGVSDLLFAVGHSETCPAWPGRNAS
jgi:hypothetical protein